MGRRECAECDGERAVDRVRAGVRAECVALLDGRDEARADDGPTRAGVGRAPDE